MSDDKTIQSKKEPLWSLLLVTAIAGTLSAFSMAPYHLWFLLLMGFAALMIAIEKSEKNWHSFLCGWLFGFFYFAFSLSWIGNALLVEGNDYAWAWPLAVSGLPALLAFFPALACYGAKRFLGYSTLSLFLGLSALLSLSELARSYIFTGFPWNSYGYTWGNHLEMLQILHIGNVFWLSAFTVFWGIGLGYFFLISTQTIKAAITFLAILSTMCSCYLYGSFRLQTPPTPPTDVTIKLAQPNVPQADKWKREKMPEHFERLLNLSKPSGAETQTTLIVWPETATNHLFLNNEFWLMQIRDTLNLYENDAFLVTGALLRNDDLTPANSLLVLDKNAETIHRYDKSHLVPFGEYIPFQNWIPIQTVSGFSGFKKGAGPQDIKINDEFSFSPLICYEILFPSNVVPQNTQPDAIINVTNDGWYGQSAGPHQHYLKARFRAIEEAIPVIRIANTGFSGGFDSLGRELQKIDWYKSEVAQVILPSKTSGLFTFGQHSNLILSITMLLIVLILFIKRRKLIL